LMLMKTGMNSRKLAVDGSLSSTQGRIVSFGDVRSVPCTLFFEITRDQ
jgi:hypothetical protein